VASGRSKLIVAPASTDPTGAPVVNSRLMVASRSRIMTQPEPSRLEGDEARLGARRDRRMPAPMHETPRTMCDAVQQERADASNGSPGRSPTFP
jgi:hypothetical protein